MPPLPDDFHFSQSNLQDFVDCTRRFQLKHLQRRAWPAVEAEPVLERERRLEQGSLFHRMVHQHIVGVSEERLTAPDAVGDGELQAWWRNYLAHRPAAIRGEKHPELRLQGTIVGHRLVATYDLVVVRPDGGLTIFDWKTSRRRSNTAWLTGRLQTRVYPYLLVEAGSHLCGGRPVDPGQVEMIYWFSGHPDDSERLVYSRLQYDQDGAYLEDLVGQVEGLGAELAERPADEKPCRFCTYRSLCDRGVEAANAGLDGDALEEREPMEIDIDLGDIDAVAY